GPAADGSSRTADTRRQRRRSRTSPGSCGGSGAGPERPDDGPASTSKAVFSGSPSVDGQNHLSEVLSALQPLVRRARAFQRKGGIDDRPDPPLLPAGAKLLEDGAKALPLVPEPADVDAEDALVGIHQLNGVKEGRLQQGAKGI